MAGPNSRAPYGGLTRGILGVLAVGSLVVTFAALPGLALALAPFVSHRRYHPATIRRTVLRLQKRHLVTWRKRGSEPVLALTDAGRRQVLRHRLDTLSLKRAKRWDGRWRVVTFDIPEERKAAREALRAKLRHLEFYQLQRSVFITPHDCREVVAFLKEFYDLGRCVQYLEASHIDCREQLREHFDL